MVDTPDPAGLASFWEAATGWIAEAADLFGKVTLRPPGGDGPHLELLPTGDPKVAKNRVHLDVAPYSSDHHDTEVARLRAVGASDVDVGQGERSWTVLADPQGNEFCVLSPRG